MSTQRVVLKSDHDAIVAAKDADLAALRGKLEAERLAFKDLDLVQKKTATELEAAKADIRSFEMSLQENAKTIILGRQREAALIQYVRDIPNESFLLPDFKDALVRGMKCIALPSAEPAPKAKEDRNG